MLDLFLCNSVQKLENLLVHYKCKIWQKYWHNLSSLSFGSNVVFGCKIISLIHHYLIKPVSFNQTWHLSIGQDSSKEDKIVV